MWEIVAAAALSAALGSSSDSASYTPNPTWLAMREDIMKSIQAGLDKGGYTWSDATNETLKRLGVEAAATPYKGAQERVMSGLAPYGNVGAMGRGLVGLNTSRAIDEATAKRNIDVNREQTKLNSYNQLLSLGAGIQDPNLPQAQMSLANAQNPSTAQIIGAGLGTGVGTAMNLNQAQANENFWNKYLAMQSGGGNSMGFLNNRNKSYQGFGPTL